MLMAPVPVSLKQWRPSVGDGSGGGETRKYESLFAIALIVGRFHLKRRRTMREATRFTNFGAKYESAV